MVWDAAGTAMDLSTFGGAQSSASHINASGQMLGTCYRDNRGIGFLCSRKHGMVPIGTDAGDQYGTALNDNGEVAGNNLLVSSGPAYRCSSFIWSLRRGLRPLPVVSAANSKVYAAEQAARDGPLRRAHAQGIFSGDDADMVTSPICQIRARPDRGHLAHARLPLDMANPSEFDAVMFTKVEHNTVGAPRVASLSDDEAVALFGKLLSGLKFRVKVP